MSGHASSYCLFAAVGRRHCFADGILVVVAIIDNRTPVNQHAAIHVTHEYNSSTFSIGSSFV
jgi:hypothetical protein